MPLGVAAAWKFQALLNRDHTSPTTPTNVVMKDETIVTAPPEGMAPRVTARVAATIWEMISRRMRYVVMLRSRAPMRTPTSTP